MIYAAIYVGVFLVSTTRTKRRASAPITGLAILINSLGYGTLGCVFVEVVGSWVKMLG